MKARGFAAWAIVVAFVVLVSGIAAQVSASKALDWETASISEADAVAKEFGLSSKKWEYHFSSETLKYAQRNASYGDVYAEWAKQMEVGESWPWWFENPNGKEIYVVTRKPDKTLVGTRFYLDDKVWKIGESVKKEPKAK
ncbi:MAG TPA: hypothetical protein VD973_28675 [Symbiobacteriaceae bacterium]|jgi:hypothetical protein|nr:hypothetical protein [Symbiobacteriaceae bacterium]